MKGYKNKKYLEDKILSKWVVQKAEWAYEIKSLLLRILINVNIIFLREIFLRCTNPYH